MVAIFTSIYGCQESLPIQVFCAAYCTRSARAHRGPNDRGAAHLAESFLGGVPAIGTCPGRHWAVHFCATTHKSPCRHFCMGERPRIENVGKRGQEDQLGDGYVEPHRGSAHNLVVLAKLISAQLFPHAKMAHSLLSAIPKVRPFAPYSKQSAHAMFVWMIDTPATVST